MDCSHPTTRLILSNGRYSGVAFCADCGAQLATKGDDMPTMTTPTAEDLREVITDLDPDDLTLLLEVMRTARDLQTQAPGKSTE